MYQVVRQRRKSIGIYVDKKLQVIIKAPYHLRDEQIKEIIDKHSEWIANQREKQKQLNEQTDWLAKRSFMYLGELKRINIIRGVHKKQRVDIIGESINIYAIPSANDEEIRELMLEWLKKDAYILFNELAEKYSSITGLKYNRITIRNQKTRWGSCSVKGNLSFNVKLMCAPIMCIEYVVLHEIMHLKYFDHKQHFWHEIASIMPEYNTYIAYLKRNGKMYEIK